MSFDTPNKRQKMDPQYKSTVASQLHGAYNSDNDSGDEFANFVPDTPGGGAFQTQPTQILDTTNTSAASPIATPKTIVQVPASSPFTGRDSETARYTPTSASQSKMPPARTLASSMAPAGTTFKPPNGVVGKPAEPSKASVTIDLDSDFEENGLHMFASANTSSGEEDTQSADIKPTKFAPKSAHNSFGASHLSLNSTSRTINGTSDFQRVTQNAYYNPNSTNSAHSGSIQSNRMQGKPERARPIEDITMESVTSPDKIARLRMVYPHATVLVAQNALVSSKGSMDDAMELLGCPPSLQRQAPLDNQRMRECIIGLRRIMNEDEFLQIGSNKIKDAINKSNGNIHEAAAYLSNASPVITIDDDDDDDELSTSQQPQMKRTLNKPVQSFRDKFSSTQRLPPKQSGSSTSAPAAPAPVRKRKLMQGRRNPSQSEQHPITISSPPRAPTPVEPEFFDSGDSGVASESEADPELEGRVLKFLNNCTIDTLVELASITKEVAAVMIDSRPFRSVDAARAVENQKTLKSGKKSKKMPIGEKIVDTVTEMTRGYEAVDTMVKKCDNLGKPLVEEMTAWGFDVFGAAKGGELEMTSLEDDDSQKNDSGIGSPSSAATSTLGDNDKDIKATAGARRKLGVKFLKKPDLMADDCVLKDYQVVGLNWLDLMWRHELSCILADEMGLGKTCQVIAFLTHLVETGHPGPHLVVCPGSTLENWMREVQKFSPHLMVEPYHGLQKERGEMAEAIMENRDRINVVVTTYDMAAKRDDNKFLRKLNPTVCVYDEGHMLKNVKSQRYQGLVKIPAKFRLLLTGTPLQNNLQELAALLAFILPSVFKEVEDDLTYIFKAKATTSDSDHAALLSQQRITRARSMLTPFVLRRKKDQVLKHLPGKVCRVEYASLHPAQKEIYDGHIDQARERARSRVAGEKISKSDENNPLMQLRKAAVHPLLFRRHFTEEKIQKMADILRRKEPAVFDPEKKREHLVQEMRNASDYWLHGWCRDFSCIRSFDVPDGAWMNSGKVESMVKLVKQYKENGDRVLIFSQFSLVLDILESVLNTALISFTRIDGSTKIDERQSLIDTYRDDESITAFLLTTKAGGTGINLMYANKVIIFDGSFNPQDDRQAENRAHRVGQTREVEVVRLVTRGTVEEQIFALGQSKLTLDGRVAGELEDGNKAEEAGEKAISRMLLDGTGLSSEETKNTEMDNAKAKAKDMEEDIKKDAKNDEGLKPSSQSRKRSSIIGDMLTKKEDAPATTSKRKSTQISKDEDVLLV